MNRYQKVCYKFAKERVKDEGNWTYPEAAFEYFYSVEKLCNKSIPLDVLLRWAYGKE